MDLTAAFLPVIVLVVLVMFITIVFLATRYKRCPSDKILVVYGKVGKGQSALCIHGGGAFIWPLIQDYTYMSLTPLTIPIPLTKALSLQNIRVNVPSTFTVGVSTEEAIMNNAAERLLNLRAGRRREHGARNHLWPAAPHGGLADHRADQPGPREIPRRDPAQRRARAQQDRPVSHQREHHRHHGRVGLHREHRQEGRVGSHQPGQGRRLRPGPQGFGGRSRAGARAHHQGRAERRRIREGQEAGRSRSAHLRAAQETLAAIGEAEANRDKEIKVAQNEATSVQGQKKAEAEKRIFVEAQEAEAIAGENRAKALIAQSNAELFVQSAQASQRGQVAQFDAEAEIQQRAGEGGAAAADRREVVRAADREDQDHHRRGSRSREDPARSAGSGRRHLLKYEAEAKGIRQVLEAKAQGYQALVASANNDARAAATLLLTEKLEQLVAMQVEAIKAIKIDKVTVWDGGAEQPTAARRRRTSWRAW